MNKNLYRIVFNKTRGIMMVVAENVSAQGKGEAVSSAFDIMKSFVERIYLQMKSISFAAKITAGVMTLIMPLSYAQIVADPNAPGNQRPTIVQTANGLPQVNIQTPSAAGVSRNTYSQFDVQRNGAILNNSRDNVQTQTGGWVQGNPWLSGGAARVILNEVNSSNPSQLRGYVEVAGQKAEVIIANPAGIQVNGGGFINADRVTLTTGTAVVNQLNNGSLDSYRIAQGVISVDGLGLDTRDTTYTDILARSVQVNAGIWANKLKVVTGANEVSANTVDGNITQGITPIAATGPTPQFSLDVAALGGMYAGHIYLVGSEAGMGVRNQGEINATAGNLVLLSNGFLTNEGAIQAASANGNGAKLNIETVGNINNRGAKAVISAQNQVTIVTTGDLINTLDARIDANQTLVVTAESVINAGKLGAGDAVTVNAQNIDNAATGEIAAVTNKITAANNLTNRGFIDGRKTLIQSVNLNNIDTGRIYGDHLAIAANTLSNDTDIEEARSNAVIAARERMDIGVDVLNNNNGALIFSGGKGEDALNIGRYLDAQAHATGISGEINNKASTIESLGGLAISALQINNINLGFSTKVNTTYTPTYGHYIGLGGARYLESNTGMSGLEYVAPSSAYPFEAGYSRTAYQQIPEYDYAQEMYVNTYPADSNVWALFGVAVGEHGTLAARLESYNQNLRTRANRVFDHIWITSQEIVETVVDNPGTAGQIVAAGGMSLTGGKIWNDNSKIIAGGDLTILADSLTNTETKGNRKVTDLGTFRRDFVEYSPYRLRAGEFGSGAYADVIESVTTKLDTSIAIGGASVSGTGTQVAGRTSPISSLLVLNPNPNDSHIYKGDPRFDNHQQWLSSDYMLQVLSTDPNTIQKRLGDGFYEQMLIREQVADLTGRRFLDGYASDEAQYQALMQAGAAYAKDWNLVPGVSLTAAQMAQLTSDIVWLVAQEVVLPDGTKTTALVPQVYVMPRQGDLSGNGSLLAGQNVNIQLSGNLSNSGTIAGRNVMQINADNVQNMGEISGKTVNVVAQQDLVNLGGRIIAEDSLIATAGRDLTIQSTTSRGASSVGRSSSSLTQVDRVAGLYVTGDKGILVASAGHDFSVLAGVLSSKGDIQVTASNNVNLGTVDTAYTSDLTANDRNYIRTSGTQEVGSQIVSGGNTIIAAGNDIYARATTVNAMGDLALNASGDIQLVEGRATSQSDDARYATSSGFLSKSSIEIRSQSQSDTAIGSSIGGKTVAIASGGDTLIRGSNVVGDNDTTIVASHDLNIEAATNTSQSSSFNEAKKSGLFGSGGLSITYGKQEQSAEQNNIRTTAAGSTVGSIGGDVLLVAGNQYNQVASNVLAPTGDIDISGKQVNIVAAIDTAESTSKQIFKQSGLTVALSAPVISAMQAVAQSAETTSQTKDPRMQALGAANTAKAAYDTYEAAAAAASSGSASVTIAITVGGSKSENKHEERGTSVAGSSVQAGHNVSITATGAGQDSNINVIGSDIVAGNDARLKADGDINLIAAQNTFEQQSKNSSSSGGVGIALTFGGDGASLGITANASVGRGKADGNDVQNINTHVKAGNQVVLDSGDDTLLKGAVVSGKQVTANVGGDLNIESLQDTSVFKSKDQNIGGSVTVGFGFSGSINIGQSKVDADFASVVEQSGIQAGDHGFIVNVKGNTDLQGGVVASTDKAVEDNQNSFTTGTLTHSVIENHDRYEASSFSVGMSGGSSSSSNSRPADSSSSTSTDTVATASTSTDMAPADKGLHIASVSGSNGVSSVGFGSTSGSSAGTTQSGISGGTLVITDGDAQLQKSGQSAEEVVASVNRDVTTGKQTGSVVKDWDAEQLKKEVQAQAQITAAFGATAAKAVGDYSDTKLSEAIASGDEAEIDKWKEGGFGRAALHAVVGGLTGGIAGAIGAGTSQTLLPILGEKIADLDIPVEVKQVLVGGAGTLIGTIGGGAGAAAAYNATVNNYLTATDLRSKEQKIKSCRETGNAECEIKVLKEYERKNARNTAEINYSSVMTEVALKDEKQKLELLLLDPAVSDGTKAEARKSIKQLDVAINTIQKTPVLQDAAELGLMAIDVYTLGELALAKALTSVIVKNFVASKTGVILSDDAATRMALNFYTDGGYDMAPVMYKAAAQTSTRNAQATEVVLGQHIKGSPLSYEQVAETRHATYFQMDDWDKTQSIIGESNMWNINKEFLDQQISQGKSFVFTSDPRAVDIRSFTAREFEHLSANGYQLKIINGEYRAIRN